MERWKISTSEYIFSSKMAIFFFFLLRCFVPGCPVCEVKNENAAYTVDKIIYSTELIMEILLNHIIVMEKIKRGSPATDFIQQ